MNRFWTRADGTTEDQPDPDPELVKTWKRVEMSVPPEATVSTSMCPECLTVPCECE